ncbi:MAG TPA: DUF695 domain-containing protein [Saprospiraceae bacterium]|nr:DUF695 domain-containing protein [Saprospiraceae bacterium]HPN68859.1 DUF695 domain-containing protein [Saprospiraceae bacterium]
MNFFKSIFGKKDEPIKSYADFWKWFQIHEKTFYKHVKNNHDLEKGFFDKLSEKLDELKNGYFYLTGMLDENTAELVLTADGNLNNIAFVEDLVIAAPVIAGWKFTALKPASDINEFAINMGGYTFDNENLFFYFNDHIDYPDEIDICVVHNDLSEENEGQISIGVQIYLENYLGELDFVNTIDHFEIIGKHQAEKELVPISKLKDFLKWRAKEFTEKYEGTRYDTNEDEHSLMEASLENGNKLIAVINNQLLNWDRKASHPWIAALILAYDGNAHNGMPDDEDYETLDQIEEALLLELNDNEGYLNIGRQTANNERTIFFACKDFRKPSKVFFKFQQNYSDQFEIEYDLYKDKYWQSFERFRAH